MHGATGTSPHPLPCTPTCCLLLLLLLLRLAVVLEGLQLSPTQSSCSNPVSPALLLFGEPVALIGLLLLLLH
jgi:hypothetical protein